MSSIFAEIGKGFLGIAVCGLFSAGGFEAGRFWFEGRSRWT